MSIFDIKPSILLILNYFTQITWFVNKFNDSAILFLLLIMYNHTLKLQKIFEISKISHTKATEIKYYYKEIIFAVLHLKLVYPVKVGYNFIYSKIRMYSIIIM